MGVEVVDGIVTNVDVGVTDAPPPVHGGQSAEQILEKAMSDGAAADAESLESDPDVQLDEAPAETSQEEPQVETPVEPEVKPDEAKPAVQAQAPVEAKAEEFEETGTETPFTISTLQNWMKGSPALKAEVDKNPKLRDQLFWTARKAEEALKYSEMFHTPSLAKEAHTAAQERFEFRDLFEGEDSVKFFQKLMQDSYERDGEGKIRVDDRHMPVSTGAYERHMTAYRNSIYSDVKQAAQEMIAQGRAIGDVDGEMLLNAVALLERIVEGNTASQELPADLPPNVRAELEQLRAKDKASAQSSAQQVTAFGEQVAAAAHDQLRLDVRALLDKRLPPQAALSDYVKDVVVADTVLAIEKAAKSNSAHQAIVGRAVKQNARMNEGGAKVLALHQAFAKELIARELVKTLSKVTNGVVTSNQTLKAKVEAQAARREVQTSGGVSIPSRPDVKAEIAKAREASLKAGKQFKEEDLIDAAMRAQRPR